MDQPGPSPAAPRARRPPRFTLAILLSIFCAYTLLASRERPWADARIMYEVAEQLLAGDGLTTTTEWPPMSHRGRAKKIYSIYGLFPSLVSVPGVGLRKLASVWWPKGDPLAIVVTSHLAHSLLGALVCLLFFRISRRLGVSVGSSSLATAALAFATGLMVYVRIPFSEVLQTLFFTGFTAALGFVVAEPSRRRALALGAWAGALLNTKLIYTIALCGGGLYLVLSLRNRRSELLRTIAYAALAGLPGLALAGWYNWYRWANPLGTGYEAVDVNATENVLLGLYGLFFSLGKSFFLFNPPVVAALAGIRRFAHRRLLWAFVFTATPVVITYARYTFWGGDYSWGPRYLVFMIPFAVLPLGPLLDRLRAARRWLALSAVGAVLVVGLGVQLLGSAFYWDHFVRIAMAAKDGWLGHPNRSGSPTPVQPDGRCGACFEDMYAHDWLPPFSPIFGHLWLARHVPFEHDWKTAEADAPWHRHTRVTLPIGWAYNGARVDWWGQVWAVDAPQCKTAGIVLLVGFALPFAAGVFLWIRAGRRAARARDERDPAPSPYALAPEPPAA